jgi:proline iminopeptidase
MLVSVNETRLFVERIPVPSAPANAPALLALHGGLGFDHSYFRPVGDRPGLDAVLSADPSPVSELVYFDLRGHGRSDPVRDWSEADFDTFADDIGALWREFGLDSVVLLGHSYGGYLAQAAALRHPESLAGLILSSTAPAFDHAETALQLAAARATPAQLSALMDGFSGPVESDARFSDLVRTVLPIYFEAGTDALAEAVAQRMQVCAAAFNRGQFGLLPTFDVTDPLAHVTVPTLCIGGTADWMAPPTHGPERLADLLPEADLRVLDGCGHFPFLERPEAFAAAVGEWARTHILQPSSLNRDRTISATAPE